MSIYGAVCNCGHHPKLMMPADINDSTAPQIDEWLWYQIFVSVSSGMMHDSITINSEWWRDGHLAESTARKDDELIKYKMLPGESHRSLTAEAVANAEDWRMHTHPELVRTASNWKEHIIKEYVAKSDIYTVRDMLVRALQRGPLKL